MIDLQLYFFVFWGAPWGNTCRIGTQGSSSKGKKYSWGPITIGRLAILLSDWQFFAWGTRLTLDFTTKEALSPALFRDNPFGNTCNSIVVCTFVERYMWVVQAGVHPRWYRITQHQRQTTCSARLHCAISPNLYMYFPNETTSRRLRKYLRTCLIHQNGEIKVE